MRIPTWSLVATLVLFLLASAGVQAKIYRVVGPDGKVHYTDKPPADEAAETEVLSDSSVEGSTPKFSVDGPDLAPIRPPQGASLRNVLLERLSADHKDAGFNSDPVVGQAMDFVPAFTGGRTGACRSPGDVHLSSLLKFFSAAKFDEAWREKMREVGYRTASGEEKLFAMQESAGADLSLAAKIVDVQVRACGSRRLVKASSDLTVEWILFDNLRRRVVFEGSTRGVDNGYLGQVEENGLQVSLHNAFSMALERLLADESFASLLVADAASAAGLSATEPVADLTPVYAPAGTRRFSQRARELMGSVCTVRVPGGHGSGFLVDGAGHVLTNRHVVANNDSVLVVFDGQEYEARVVARGELVDVALLAVDMPAGPQPLGVASMEPVVGEELYIVGTPLHESLQHTVTRGILSSVRMESDVRFFQTDAAVNPGNSGGPVFDQYGNVVAIAVASLRDKAGSSLNINYLIPMRDALSSLGVTAPIQ